MAQMEYYPQYLVEDCGLARSFERSQSVDDLTYAEVEKLRNDTEETGKFSKWKTSKRTHQANLAKTWLTYGI